jgi:CBS domain-containing protein
MPEIKAIVRDEVVSASPETPLVEVAQLMDEELVGSVVVVDGKRPRGIVTDRDITTQVVARGDDPASLTAGDVMNETLRTVDVDSGIFEVLRTMADAKVRRIPAVDADGDLAGIVTFDDFVILLGREFKLLGEVVEAEVPPYDT